MPTGWWAFRTVVIVCCKENILYFTQDVDLLIIWGIGLGLRGGEYL